MTEVFVLIDDMGYDGEHLLGVFSTLEGAQTAVGQGQRLNWERKGSTLSAVTNEYSGNGYLIRIAELDEAYDWMNQPA